MKPTRMRILALTAAVAGLGGYLLARLAYGSIPPLPSYAPISLVLLALVEAALAWIVRDRLAVRRFDASGRPRGRPLHPIQVAKAAVLAKASSPTGALLLGFYAGFVTWTYPHRSSLSAARDTRVCLASAASALALVVAGVALERACRAPEPPDTSTDLQSPA